MGDPHHRRYLGLRERDSLLGSRWVQTSWFWPRFFLCSASLPLSQILMGLLPVKAVSGFRSSWMVLFMKALYQGLFSNPYVFLLKEQQVCTFWASIHHTWYHHMRSSLVLSPDFRELLLDLVTSGTLHYILLPRNETWEFWSKADWVI